MRKIKLVKTVVPELVAYEFRDAEIFRDYRCECGMGVGEEHNWCPYCGAKLEFRRVNEKRKFRKIFRKDG